MKSRRTLRVARIRHPRQNRQKAVGDIIDEPSAPGVAPPVTRSEHVPALRQPAPRAPLRRTLAEREARVNARVPSTKHSAFEE